MESFGEYIKSQRELRSVSREEVSSITKVSLRYLDALETDKSEFLPARPFVVGFLRVYSNYLGLDDDAVVTRYISCNCNSEDKIEAVDKKVNKKKRVGIFIASFALALLLCIFLLLRDGG